MAETFQVAPDKMWSLSPGEMERRWSLVRHRLIERGLDALVIQSYEDKSGGYVKWLTDVPAGYPRTVVFHANDWMSVVDHGAHGEIRVLDGRDPKQPGVGEIISNWGFFNAHYNQHLNAADTIGILRKRGYRKIGLVNGGGLPHRFVQDLSEEIDIVDETDFIDGLKARKSVEEIGLIRRTAAAQDAAFEMLLNHVKPGMRDFEINAFLDYQLQLRGAERGTYIGHSAPIGKPATFAYRHFQGRTMAKGDHICVLLESNGAGGLWTEIARTICFGRASSELRDGFELCKAAQLATSQWCVPNAAPAEIFARYNEYMTSHGAGPERRLHSHGQGHDMVERPLIREDETMSLFAGCNLAIHPTHATPSMFAHICDNFVIDESGHGEFIHATPKQIFEL